MKIWDLDCQNTRIGEIFDWSVENHKVDHALLAVRLERRSGKWRSVNAGLDEKIETLFKNNIDSTFLASAWPATTLSGHPTQIFLLEFNQEVRDLMIATEPYLRCWTHGRKPPLPEDICLFREGDKLPVFVSCTHEKGAWLLSEKRVKLPNIRLSRFNISDLLIPNEKHFCTLWKR